MLKQRMDILLPYLEFQEGKIVKMALYFLQSYYNMEFLILLMDGYVMEKIIVLLLY